MESAAVEQGKKSNDLAGDIASQILSCPINPWQGSAWRCHSRKWPADDPGGSLKVTGRFNRGTDFHAGADCWPALYTGLSQAIVLAEKLRHSKKIEQIDAVRISELSVALESVLTVCVEDDSDPFMTVFGSLATAGLCHSDYEVTHLIAQEVRQRAEAMLIPSCTRIPGGNLIIFTDRLHPSSRIEVIEAIDPELRPRVP